MNCASFGVLDHDECRMRVLRAPLPVFFRRSLVGCDGGEQRTWTSAFLTLLGD